MVVMVMAMIVRVVMVMVAEMTIAHRVLRECMQYVIFASF